MRGALPDSRIHRRLIDVLYVDAMVLADEARSYFDDGGRADREALPPLARVAFSCESLKVTTRLMHVIAWLLTQRAVSAGEMAPRDALDPSRRLGPAPISDAVAVAELPARARALIGAGVPAGQSPARSMQERLATAF
jgi:regulator of CtrA degradation